MNIPVKLYSGSKNNTLNLDMLRKGDLCPVRYSRVCRADGKEIPWNDIVKGYEYREGDYVVLEKEDFEKANVEKTKTIDIVDFTKESEVDTIFFERPYYLEPQKSGMKPAFERSIKTHRECCSCYFCNKAERTCRHN